MFAGGMGDEMGMKPRKKHGVTTTTLADLMDAPGMAEAVIDWRIRIGAFDVTPFLKRPNSSVLP